MGAAMIVSLIGMSGLVVARLQFRQAVQTRDWAEAGDLALSAVELGILRINATPTWRTDFANNVESTPIALGNGTLSYKLVDAALGVAGGDGSLGNNAYDPVRLHGIGRVGNTVRAYSVQLVGDTPLDVLRTSLATSGYLDNRTDSTTACGPLSSNGLFTRSGAVYGNVEAGSVTGSNAINGTLTTPAPAKTFPEKSVFDGYKRIAAELTWPGGADWRMNAARVDATINPYGATNPNGIYYVNVPAGKKLKIEISHTKGTFVVDCQDKATVEVTQPMYWEPHTPDLPILLIRHLTTSAASDKLAPDAGTVVEGVATYPSQLNGLVHVIGAPGTPSGDLEVRVSKESTFRGTLIIDQDAKIESASATFNWNANLFYYPPIGYTTGPTMKINSGSSQWELAP